MSVYRRPYEPYCEPLTSERWRFLVVSRFALRELFASRAVMAFFVIAGLPCLVAALIIYLFHNPAARTLIGLVKLVDFLRIDAEFFRHFLSGQCFLGLILSAWVGPRLIASDLANGALPLYFSRPLSRFEYFLGKALVLVVMLSCVTWLPGVLLYLLNAALADGDWAISNLRLVVALFTGAMSWILATTLFVIALATWIRWNLAATSSVFGIYFISAGLGEALSVALQWPWGRVVSVGHLYEVLWAALFGVTLADRGVSERAAALALGLLCALAALVINKRLCAREVVR